MKKRTTRVLITLVGLTSFVIVVLFLTGIFGGKNYEKELEEAEIEIADGGSSIYNNGENKTYLSLSDLPGGQIDRNSVKFSVAEPYPTEEAIIFFTTGPSPVDQRAGLYYLKDEEVQLIGNVIGGQIVDNLSWSPDNKNLAFQVRSSEESLYDIQILKFSDDADLISFDQLYRGEDDIFSSGSFENMEWVSETELSLSFANSDSLILDTENLEVN
ncbi:hypothetical protein CEY16_13790 [Halalkalibacillus sediminis]|uniref:Uncharacterized protein n=1 Tax=Halalkalibacillus sediminis TaxID=2018042 RepID=A0A2I0QRD3_9BACI|nr:hypothetical protein [Halalkalibacillus sediminis]PKR76879.1 hypothetical protein CEY16_13790 [Halalkalibacillus sediminis]